MLKANLHTSPNVYYIANSSGGIGTLFFREKNKCMFWFYDLAIDAVIKKPSGFAMNYTDEEGKDKLKFIQDKIDSGELNKLINVSFANFNAKLNMQRRKEDDVIRKAWTDYL